MSNPDLPGPYWQDQDNAGYGSAWRGEPNGPARSDSPWEDGAGFWRGGGAGARSAEGSPVGRGQRDGHVSWGERARAVRGGRRSARGSTQDGQYAAPVEYPGPDAAAPRSRHNGPRHGGRRDSGALDSGARRGGRADDWAGADYGAADYDAADYGRSAGRRGYPESAGERTGRFSQTADDLRNRLGLRGSALSRGKRELAGLGAADYPPDDFGVAPAASRAARADRGGYRGSRRARGTAGFGGYGDADGYDDRLAGSRTALGDQRDDWPGEYRGGRGTGTTQRIGRGGGGGGRGGGRGRGGGWHGDDQTPRNFRERIRHSLRTGRWWRHWSLKKVLGVLGGAFAAFVLLAILGFFIIYSMTPIRSAADQQALWQSSTVYFSDGKLLGTFANQGQSRQVLTTAQIPQVMNQAMVAAEDRHFYTEGGISIPGIFRAAYQDLFGSGGLQGGSTITEQYAKNSYASIGTSQSITTKIKEIFVAIKLAHARPKSWIMTQYLNIVPFGPQTYGVGAAAQQYFGINLASPGEAKKLTVAEAAMLASMPNAPSVLNPDPSAGADFAALVTRWQYVLNGMVTDNAITQQQANALCANCSLGQAEKAFEKNVKVVPAGQNSGFSGYRYYLMQMVQSELESKYHLSQNQIDTSGLKITTTFSPSMITQLNHAVNLNVKQMKIDARQGNGNPLPWYAHVGGALIDPKTGGILAIYGGPGASLSTKACNKVHCYLNTAEIPHQPGSSFKPYVLATAISQGMNAKTSILNAYSPICVPPDYPFPQLQLSARISLAACSSKEPLGYWPATDSSSLGGIPVAEAAAISSNPGFMDLAHRVGIDNVISKAASFGVGSTPYFTFGGVNDLTSKYGLKWTFGSGGQPPDQHPGSVTMTLGASGTDVTAIEQASTFATLAADGVFHLPHVIAAISGGPKPITVTIPHHQALTPAQAADEDYALSFDNQPTYAADGATGYPAAYWGSRPVIAKTGTTDTAQAAWFIGAIPQYALAVTLYTDQQCSQSTSACYQTLNNLPKPANSYLAGGFGGAWPATIWHTFMTSAFANLPVANLPPPDFGNPFVKWNQVPPPPKHKATCGQGQGGQGQGNGNGHGKQCKGCPPGGFFGQPCGGNPSPTPSCGPGTGQQCGSPSPSPTSPSPSPTCHGNGQPCRTTSPTPTPTSPSPSCSQGPPCLPSPGTLGAISARQATTTALIRPAPGLTPLQLEMKVRAALLGQRL